MVIDIILLVGIMSRHYHCTRLRSHPWLTCKSFSPHAPQAQMKLVLAYQSTNCCMLANRDWSVHVSMDGANGNAFCQLIQTAIHQSSNITRECAKKSSWTENKVWRKGELTSYWGKQHLITCPSWLCCVLLLLSQLVHRLYRWESEWPLLRHLKEMSV
jgi:hypothetical protein